MTVVPILADNYETDAGRKNAFGINDLLTRSINRYNELKIELLGEKKQKIEKQERNYALLKSKADKIVEKYAAEAFGFNYNSDYYGFNGSECRKTFR